MTRLNRIAAILGTTLTLVGAAPASAHANGTIDRIMASVEQTRATCGSNLRNAACGTQQDKLLVRVAVVTSQSRAHASVDEVSRRQLDALVASIN